jgi:hypothetical protein
MNLRRFHISGLVLLAGVLLFSCGKMDDTYDDFIRNGEIIYPAKVQDVKTFPGNNRIDLSMILTSDPKITAVKVFWNNGKDSATQQVTRTSGVDTVKFALTNIPEGAYTFNIYTYDKDGNRSVKSDVIGNVYGSRYTTSLYNRSIKSATYLAGSQARVVWFGAANQMIGQHIRYTDSLGVMRNVIEPLYLPNGITPKDTTLLTVFKKGSAIEFRTLFKPEPSSIDTFYSNFETKTVL